MLRLKRFFSEDVAKRLIAERVKSLEIEARAEKFFNYVDASPATYTHSTSQAFRLTDLYTPQKTLLPTRHNVTISNVWSQSIDWEADLKRWIWHDGDFCITYGNDPLPIRWRMIGVSFLEDDLLDVAKFRRFLSNVPSSAERIKSKSTPKWDWESLFVELIAIADADGLIENPDILGMQGGKPLNLFAWGGLAALQRWMSDSFSRKLGPGEGPSTSEVRSRATAIRDALKKRNPL